MAKPRPRGRRPNGAAIRSLREAIGISQKTLAQRVGISQSAMSQVESGTQKGMEPEKLRGIADSLGVPLDAISIPVHEGEALAAS